MNLVNDKYEALVKSYLDGNCPAEDALELLSWVAESEENRIYFKSQKEADEVWSLTDFAMPDDAALNVEAALDAVNEKIDTMEESGAKIVEMPWLRRNYKYVSGIAAALVVALFLGFLVVRPMNSNVTVALNEQNIENPVMLPDGTSVTYSGAAEITYPKHFIKATRSVDFEGVAIFDVVADENNPFVIHCDKMDVEVLGTSFLLNAEPSSDKYFVDLYTGKVKMTAFDEKGPAGHLIMRFTDEKKSVIRFGFIIVDKCRRGQGLGREMLELAVKYAFEILKAEKITLGVFENNPRAYRCYLSAGFTLSPADAVKHYTILDEDWKCLELQMTRHDFMAAKR